MFRAGPIPVLMRCLALLAALVSSLEAVALTEVRFNRLGMEQGLSQSSVAAIAQCPDGYLWFATQYGLDRFDGYQVRSFRHDSENSSSLSHSRISDIRLAADGRLWVLTSAGLDRFDTRTGKSERFDWADPAPDDSERATTEIVGEHPDGRLFLSARGVIRVWHPDTGQVHTLAFASDASAIQQADRSSVIDHQGRFWTFNSAGLWRLDEASQQLQLVLPVPQTPEFPMFRGLAVTADGLIALAADEVFKLIAPESLEVVERLTLADLGGVDERINGVMATSDGLVWLPTPTRLLRYRPTDRSLTVMFSGGRLDPAETARQQMTLAEHPSGDLWFSSQYGLAHLDAETGAVRVFAHDPGDPSSMPPTIPQRPIALFIDDRGLIWIGTSLGGVGWHAPGKARFQHIRDQSRPSQSAIPFSGHNVVRGVLETTLDEHTDLWLVLENAGVRRLRQQPDGSFGWYRSYHRGADPALRLPEDQVRGMAADPTSDLVWVVGNTHLAAIDARSDSMVTSIALSELPGLNRHGRVLRFSSDGRRLWLGTGAGVWQLTLGEDRTRPQPEAGGLLPELRVSYLLETAAGDVLVGSREGLGLIQPDRPQAAEFFPLESLAARPPGYLHAIAEHPETGFWLAGREIGVGHLRFERGFENRRVPQVQWFGIDDGLADSTIYALIPQPDGRLWMSSNNGLMRWNPETGRTRQFTPADGVQALEFNQGVAYRSRAGDLYFGGVNGVNRFRPEWFGQRSLPPRLRLQNVLVNAEAQALEVWNSPALRLAHNANDLEIQFAALDFADPARTRYAWRLQGVDEAWVEGGDQRRVRYASLAPGTYRFWLRAANSDGVWSDDALLLTATVLPPPWASPVALAAYGILVIGLAALLYAQARHRRRVLEAEVAARTATLSEQRRLIEQQAQELERVLETRTVLFANVSHEFRTPLTLIKTSLDRLEREGASDDSIRLGRRYLQRLLKLVDQLMDFSRLSYQQCEADRKPWPLGRMVRMTVDAFAAVAEGRGIELIVEVEYGWRTRCDQEQVEKILLNLMTNALKFTPDGGQVRVQLQAHADGVCLGVADSGPGIAEQERETIFERFYRVPAVEQSGIAGAGIGLALVREAAWANGGHVSVESAPGEGSTFRVFLPAWQEPNAAGPVTLLSERDQARDIEALKSLRRPAPVQAVPAASNRPVALLVEDNPDMRAHLAELLSPDWRVLLAGDGASGLASARAEMPDIIVSDIMMPAMDGLEFLAALRQDIATSHIPVLLLTARQDHDTRIRGFALRADDFLPKPFDDQELRARLAAMMDTRQRLHEHLRRELGALPETGDGEPGLPEDSISERDRELLKRLQWWAEQHFADPDLTVADLAAAALVDVRTLQRKLKALLGRSPAAYLQEVRLAKACEMMLANGRSIKDIAASCGFSSPQAFSRVFSQAHGMPPSRWRSQQSA